MFYCIFTVLLQTSFKNTNAKLFNVGVNSAIRKSLCIFKILRGEGGGQKLKQCIKRHFTFFEEGRQAMCKVIRAEETRLWNRKENKQNQLPYSDSNETTHKHALIDPPLSISSSCSITERVLLWWLFKRLMRSAGEPGTGSELVSTSVIVFFF